MKKRVVVLSILLVMNIFIWNAVLAEEKNVLVVAFLDVGQGDSIFIESPAGGQVLIDGGAGRAVLARLGEVMPFYDRSIDVVIATHPDTDHIGGLPDVFERYDVGYFFEPGVSSDTAAYAALLSAAEEEAAAHVYARRGTAIDLGGGVALNILFPDRDVGGFETNTASVVARLVYGETEFLLTGDSPKSIEKYLAGRDGNNLKSDVLKVGHHGSRTSSSELFVGFVSPSYAIISAGCDNRYGHPHEEVLTTFDRFKTQTLSTCREGNIIFESDGTTVVVR